jgi:universal stress protein A
MADFRTILVAIDFSEAAAEAARVAIELASRLGSTVHVLHVVDDRPVAVGPGMTVDLPLAREPMIQAARERLEKLLAGMPPSTVPRQVAVRPGIPFEEILATAKELRADLLVVGTHGRTGIARAILGSQAESILRRATLPVLVVHAPQPE